MRCVPLHQPWASLVAKGAKRVETRHWPTPRTILGERVGIHACVTREHLDLCRESPFNLYVPDESELPFGAIVATAVIAACVQMTERNVAKVREERPHEYAFGDWTPGRYAWVLQEVRPLPRPVKRLTEWAGQGIFNVPDRALGIEPSGEPAAQGTLL